MVPANQQTPGKVNRKLTTSSSSHSTSNLTSTSGLRPRNPIASVTEIGSAARPASSKIVPQISSSRTALKNKSSTASREPIRPVKKLAKENDAVAPPSGIPSRGIATKATLSISSRGNSTSPVHHILPGTSSVLDKNHRLISAVKSGKKSEPSAPPSKVAVPVTFLKRGESQSNRLAHQSINSSSKSISSFPPFTKGAASKSGVENETKMDEEMPAETVSEPASIGLGSLTFSDTISTSENFASRISENALAEYDANIADLREQLRNASTNAETADREKNSLHRELWQQEENNNMLRQQLSAMNAEHEKVVAENATFRQQIIGLEENIHKLLEQNTQLELQVKNSSEQLASLEHDIISKDFELDKTRQKVKLLEAQLAASQEEQNKIKRHFVDIKKKATEDREKAVDQLANLEKIIQIKENEARSWETMTDLKLRDLRKLQQQLEELKAVAEQKTILEAELTNYKIKVSCLEVTVSACKTAKKEALVKVEEKENELRDLRRRSTMLLQEKDSLKFQLNSVSESPSQQEEPL